MLNIHRSTWFNQEAADERSVQLLGEETVLSIPLLSIKAWPLRRQYLSLADAWHQKTWAKVDQPAACCWCRVHALRVCGGIPDKFQKCPKVGFLWMFSGFIILPRKCMSNINRSFVAKNILAYNLCGAEATTKAKKDARAMVLALGMQIWVNQDFPSRRAVGRLIIVFFGLGFIASVGKLVVKRAPVLSNEVGQPVVGSGDRLTKSNNPPWQRLLLLAAVEISMMLSSQDPMANSDVSYCQSSWRLWSTAYHSLVSQLGHR